MQQRTFSEFIDFDTGKTARLPKGDDAVFNPFEITPGLLAWMQQNGLDAHAGSGKLETLGVTVVDLASADWDSLKPAELLTRLEESGRFQAELELGADGGPPATFGFRTREGGAGILQLVTLGRASEGTNIRYKLIAPPTAR